MFSEKLLTLLATFSKVELNRFKKFLSSSYLNDQPDLLRLFDLCNDALRQTSPRLDLLTKNWVWKQLFPQKNFNDAHLRRLSSDLTQLGYRFRILEHRQQHPQHDLLDLQILLDQPPLEKHLQGIENQLIKNLEFANSLSVEHYLTGFRVHWNIFNRSGRVVASSQYLDKMLPADFYLDSFYIIQKLKFYIAWLIYRGFRSSAADFQMMPSFLEYVHHARFDAVPLVQIYRKVLPCLLEPENEANFKALIEVMDANAAALDAEDLRELYHIAQNYCAFKINQGRVEYFQEMFLIFKKMIERSLLLDKEQQLPEGVFKNIITVSLQLGEFDWAQQFIESHVAFLPTSIRENARTFNLANVFFAKKQYDLVIQLLRDVQYQDVAYALGSRIMLLKVYFEQHDFDILDSQLDSFRIFLRRNKALSKNAQREHINFVNFLKKLTHLAPHDRAGLQKIERQIMENQAVSAKKWLLERVHAMS